MAAMEESMSLKLPAPLKREIKQMADKDGKSMNSYVLHAVQAYIQFMDTRK